MESNRDRHVEGHAVFSDPMPDEARRRELLFRRAERIAGGSDARCREGKAETETETARTRDGVALPFRGRRHGASDQPASPVDGQESPSSA